MHPPCQRHLYHVPHIRHHTLHRRPRGKQWTRLVKSLPPVNAVRIPLITLRPIHTRINMRRRWQIPIRLRIFRRQYRQRSHRPIPERHMLSQPLVNCRRRIAKRATVEIPQPIRKRLQLPDRRLRWVVRLQLHPHQPFVRETARLRRGPDALHLPHLRPAGRHIAALPTHPRKLLPHPIPPQPIHHRPRPLHLVLPPTHNLSRLNRPPRRTHPLKDVQRSIPPQPPRQPVKPQDRLSPDHSIAHDIPPVRPPHTLGKPPRRIKHRIR